MPENTERILSLLQNFQGIESLKQLFWVELNYKPDNTNIEGVPAGSADLIIDSPISFATAGNKNDFQVIYTRLKSDKLRKTDERQIISHLQTQFPDALYVFSNSEQNHWHFVNVILTRGKQEETDQQREEKLKIRNIFRRITIAPDERLRTAAERIALLDIEKPIIENIDAPEQVRLFERQEFVTAFEISKQHVDAFNVEAVTEAFFKDFKRVFKQLQNELDDQTGDEKWAHDYALQFLSRCLFLYFVQRKRWLGDDTEFLHSFWQAYQDTSQPTDTFVDKWLNVLFFHSFNNVSVGGRSYFPVEIRKTLQFAPYLNGGLFRENPLDKEYAVRVPDQLWHGIFDFFEKYNFTIAEDTPLDQEVAVDPEMIGKVYESLVSAEDEEKGDAGIFYTPRVEIDLMCRLALVDNLANHIGTQEDKLLFYETLFAFEPKEKAEADAKLTDLWQDAYDHITEITIVDPACGSGSFLVGMLHVLDDVQERAENHLGIIKESRFERRKAIIGKNLYGVDVKHWACKVAELRLWLALIIDAEITDAELTVRKEPLLPDFSFNIRHGDSIVQDIGGMNLVQTRAIDSVIPSNFERKIKDLKTEKLKYYNNEKDRKYKEKEDVHAAENGLFREQLGNYETEISKKIRETKAWLEDTTEQIPLLDTEQKDTEELDRQTQQKKDELHREEERLTQVQNTIRTLSIIKSPPFVWDIAFVEIFSEFGGFDIVIENPPYIRQEGIRDLMLPKEIGERTENKKLYKAKLSRAVYQAHSDFFNYQRKRDQSPDKPEKAVKHKLNGRSDLYVYFYFHGLSLLNQNGTFCSITSNSWLDAGFGAKLKEFLLTQCHLKLVIDNAARRSFKGVNINTIITLISCNDITHEKGLENTLKFINFTVPFEAILDPIIFYEIEKVTRRFSIIEHQTNPMLQRSLYEAGMNERNQYISEGWGGRYFRSPDIYWTILDKGKDILVRVGEVADVKLGIKTGSNNFFILNESEISRWDIETEFLKPFITRIDEANSILIQPEELPYYVFMCTKEKEKLSGTAALDYIEWGESQGFNESKSCRGRHYWFNIGQRTLPHLCFPRRIPSTTVKTFYTEDGCYALDKFVEVHVKADMRIPFCYYFNSTVFNLIVNVNGRSSLGYGALEIQAADLKTLLCINTFAKNS